MLPLPMKLSKRQTEVLAYILDCWRDGWIPSHRTIAKQLGMAWGTIHKHITALKRKGYLADSETKTSLRLTPMAMGATTVTAADKVLGLHGVLQGK